MQSATLEAETHTHAKGTQRYVVNIAIKPKVLVTVHIETTLE